ncbi:hypothetical protein BCR35DRAFT_281272 [Leucosporidium creatinivorum]|uniref:Aminopeptidase n=1 Tax=Leucosporidium creatinivorum TaxID=106004 RepID=A0A1Y2ET11_9BASI|nr:hypothetical protein BCR35DRAFT_281272 [Leucosporidium creatinivorum]
MKELTTLSFEKELAAGDAVLGFRWEGSLDAGSMLGYYRIPGPPSEEEGTEPEYYAVTQMQPTMARRAFPCFDHPAKKAVFAVSLISPKGLVSLSNTPEVSRSASKGNFPSSDLLSTAFLAEDEGKLADASSSAGADGVEWELVTFEPTPIMTSYLVAWAVGRFSSISSSYVSPLTQRTVPLNVYAASSFEHIERGQGQLALDTLAKVMPVYEKLFDIPYELGKLDILVCDAFDAGGMENWGLITGKTMNLLHDAERSGMQGERMVVSTVSHEAAHMWFGNLVSMAWWDDLWLNEGFATLMGEVIALHEIEPSWNVHASFLKYHRTSALELDALRSSHPVQMVCEDDSEDAVTQSFDAISYEKGSAVLKMLSQVIGEEAFIRGTSTYLKAHAHSCSTSGDLWRAMSEASGIDVAALMDSWISKIGFPVVSVEETAEGLKLRQNRFLSTGDPKPEEDETIWTIPLDLKLVGSDAPVEKILMSTRELVLPLPQGLYKLNSETSGTFRVSYPPAHLSKLAEEASKPRSGLSLADRLGLVQDVILLSEAGYTPTSSALDLMKQMVSEPEHLVWVEIAQAFQRLVDAWWEQPEEIIDGVRAFARSLFGPLVEKVGFSHQPEEDAEARQFRVLAIAAAAAAEEPSFLAWIQQAFGLLASGHTDETLADLAPIIVTTTVKHGGAMEYNIALAIYNNPPTPQHQLAAIGGLTSTRDSALIQQAAGMLMGGQVAEQNMTMFLHGLAANPLSRRLVWQFVAGAWPMLEMQFQGSFHLGKIAQFSFQSLSTEEDAAQVEAFFADKETSQFIQPLQQGLDTVRAKARWLNRAAEDVKQWLEKNEFLSSDA